MRIYRVHPEESVMGTGNYILRAAEAFDPMSYAREE